MEYSISNKCIAVTASTIGAELLSVRSADRTEFLWQGDPDIWKGHAPNLFPYIARLTNGQYTYKGKRYELPIHGFAPTSEFELAEINETRMVFSLASNNLTLKSYPYHFLLEIIYEIRDKTLTQTYTVSNLNKDIMYFGIGAHPGFNIPIGNKGCFEDHYLDFDIPCSPVRIGFSEDCFLNGNDVPFTLDEDRRLSLSHELFDNDAIVLENIPDRVTLRSKHGQHRICISYPDMKYLGLWHAPHTTAGYICIEPWSSLPSRKGVIEDLEEQKDLLSLPGGEVYKTTVAFEFL